MIQRSGSDLNSTGGTYRCVGTNEAVGARRFGILLAVGVAVVAVGATAGQASKSQDGYTLGLSNTLVGNGWREGQLCAFKAQALASGKVDSLRIAHRATDTAGQISDIRGMISAGVDAIVINPSSPTALKPVAAQARARGIEVVFIDQYVNAPGVYNASNDQVGVRPPRRAEWLFKKMRGRGNVVEMRGIAGVPADTDRHKGFLQALKKYPRINVVKSVFTGWQFAPARSRCSTSSTPARRSTACGRRGSTTRSSTPSGRPASGTCRSSAPTTTGSCGSSRRASRRSRARR